MRGTIRALEKKLRKRCFLDSDDLFLPGKLSTMAEALADDDGHAVLYSRMKVDRGVDRYWIRPDRGIREDEDVPNSGGRVGQCSQLAASHVGLRTQTAPISGLHGYGPSITIMGDVG